MNTSILHDDLIVQILLRLPVRSLLRFKCVCKSWLSLISNPQFAKSHFDLSASPTHRLLLDRINNDSQIESFDLSSSLYDDSAVVRLHYPRHPHMLEIWGMCRGFLLLAKEYRVVIVWNPSTGTTRKIRWSSWSWNHPQPPRKKVFGRFDELIGQGIGYDELNDDYLIVFIGLDSYCFPRIEVFSLKSNSLYFISGNEVKYDTLADSDTIGVFLNHSLHWLVFSKAKGVEVILAFHLIDRSLSEIPQPREVELDVGGDYNLTIMGGCLGLCLGCRSNMTKVWVMKEYKVHSSWTESLVLPLVDYPYEFFDPVWFTEDGGVLGPSWCGRVIKLNDKGEIIEVRECRPHDESLMHYDIYRESLLSLPDDFAEDEEEITEDEEDGESSEYEEAIEDGEEATLCIAAWLSSFARFLGNIFNSSSQMVHKLLIFTTHKTTSVLSTGS